MVAHTGNAWEGPPAFADVLFVLNSRVWRSQRIANVCRFSPALLYGLLYTSMEISKRLSHQTSKRSHKPMDCATRFISSVSCLEIQEPWIALLIPKVVGQRLDRASQFDGKNPIDSAGRFVL
jgi:hypothetical protein